MNKRIIALLLIAVVSFSLFCSCSEKSNDIQGEVSSDIQQEITSNIQQEVTNDEEATDNEEVTDDEETTGNIQEEVPNNEEVTGNIQEEVTGNIKEEAPNNEEVTNDEEVTDDIQEEVKKDKKVTDNMHTDTSYTYCTASLIYAGSANVYTGTLLDIELYDEGYSRYGDIYKIKVKVDEVIKGSFKEGETVEDYCLAYFDDLNCRYLFMTGVDIECGYTLDSYCQAGNIFYGKVLEKERIESPENYPYPVYRFKAEVTEVIKGTYNIGDIVEDVTGERLQNIRDDVILTTASRYNDYNLRHSSLEASEYVYKKLGNMHSMVKLLGNNQIQYYSENIPQKYLYKTEEELMNKLRSLAKEISPSPFGDPFFPTTPELANIRSKHNCPCEYSESEIEEILKIIENIFGSDIFNDIVLNQEDDAKRLRKDAMVDNELYCDKHSMNIITKRPRDFGYYQE